MAESANAAVPAPPAAALAIARAMAIGRVGIGAALLVAPRALARPWLGARTARTGGTAAALRALGIRDLILGALTLHTLSHPQVAPRLLLSAAAADAVDAAATWAARDDLPASAAGVTAVAAGSAAAGAALAAALRRPG